MHKLNSFQNVLVNMVNLITHLLNGGVYYIKQAVRRKK
jgi:hypothetical protein